MNDLTDAEILAEGWMAMRHLQEHGDNAGIPILTPGACRPCVEFVAALLRGADPADVLHLRCSDAQEWHQQVQKADAIARAITQ